MVSSLNRDPIDLHTHTTASDGTDSPRQLVDTAREAGLVAVAVTDHDTIAGVAEAQQRGLETGVEVIPGIEISAKHEGQGVSHILGYFVDIDDEHFRERISWVQARRNERNPQIIAKLNNLGIDVSYDEVCEIAGEGQVGRPHIAQALVRRGAAVSVKDAFNRYLHTTAPAYVAKEKLPLAESIDVIRKAGGVAVLAHPYQTWLDDEALEQYVEKLADLGLGGIECWYTQHTVEQTDHYRALAYRYNLVATGGSDYHGSTKPDVRLGVVSTGGPIPYSIVEELRSRCRRPKGDTR